VERIFINLKRFEVPIERGGVCPSQSPGEWISSVIRQCVELGYGDNEAVRLVFFLPEALVVTAKNSLDSFPPEKRRTLEIGCQGVFREDIRPGGNFGAFTANLPATAAANLGCTWAIIGHSEERNDKMGVLREFAPEIDDDSSLSARALVAVDRLVNQEVLRALEADLNVLICVGETAAERGDGGFASQQRRIEKVLRRQILTGLEGAWHLLGEKQIVIGYEPIWAIGPGKVPPGKEYVQYVTERIKAIVREDMGLEVPVVYGGGLKKENAGMLGSITRLDGGLVALTRFTGQIGFDPQELDEIIQAYLGSRGDS
jgi:triosephosphate isomerase